ncbi:MAG: ribose-phosphate pyrophosphokinase [Clostridia bacterium]
MTNKAKQLVFETDKMVANLSIIALKSAEELSEKIDNHLLKWLNRNGEIENNTFLVGNSCPRFQSGDGKGMIYETVRGDDVYFLVDVGNYNCKYKMFGTEVPMSPDDHYQDLKRLIQALGGKSHRITVIMPILYGGRQHKRSFRESLDCAVALQELENMGVSNIITFDAHDSRVQNAIPLTGFDNIMPSYQILKALFKKVKDINLSPEHLMIISPDEGALQRNIFYSSILAVELGFFYKRRDYSKVVDGRNPIVAHEYLGSDVEGKDIFISDDIIASGESMLDLAYELKKRKANRIFCSATYCLFTSGLELFDKAYEDGIISGIVGTNLTYRSPELLKREWFMEADLSKYIAYIIASLNHDISISLVIDPHEKIQTLVKKYKEDQIS